METFLNMNGAICDFRSRQSDWVGHIWKPCILIAIKLGGSKINFLEAAITIPVANGRPGCLYNRLWRSKKQFCLNEAHVSGMERRTGLFVWANKNSRLWKEERNEKNQIETVEIKRLKCFNRSQGRRWKRKCRKDDKCNGNISWERGVRRV